MQKFTLVVPVKSLDVAKSRLEVGTDRHALALAFAQDTLAAALNAKRVRQVFVVTADPTLSAAARTGGAVVLPDEGDGDLNEVLRAAAARLPHGSHVAAMCADLPCLTAEELDQALAQVPAHGQGFVPDADDTGTTLLATHDVEAFSPQFGVGSRAAHLRVGAHEIARECARLRRDVDTAADLATALYLGVGPYTESALKQA